MADYIATLVEVSRFANIIAVAINLVVVPAPVTADRPAVIAPVDQVFAGMVVEQTTNVILKPVQIPVIVEVFIAIAAQKPTVFTAQMISCHVAGLAHVTVEGSNVVVEATFVGMVAVPMISVVEQRLCHAVVEETTVVVPLAITATYIQVLIYHVVVGHYRVAVLVLDAFVHHTVSHTAQIAESQQTLVRA